ncbi:MAG TPA: hypothetical protein VMX55_10365 [candidate division Zixibacteria bacterium]|nr:hypothetical protein [candidate division Zixibacteria bacterium]
MSVRITYVFFPLISKSGTNIGEWLQEGINTITVFSVDIVEYFVKNG